MKFLHTSDWHVGKAIRGHSRADEHRAVLDEIIGIAQTEAVDLVIVAGDLFETTSPTPEAEAIVYDAFLRLAKIAPVVAISGNHDNPRRLSAIAPLLELGRVTMVTEPKAPNDGGVLDLVVGSAGQGDRGGSDEDGGATTVTKVRIALLPFVSQRSIVRADDLMSDAAFQNVQLYADRMHRVVGALSASFSADAVNLIVAHAFVQGGATGGGERAAHLADEYSVPTTAFPSTASYVALGHLHRPQVVRGATAIHYCGSPLQLDFGEEAQTKQVNIVDVSPGLPAKVTAVPLRAGRSLRTIVGTLSELADLVGTSLVSDTGQGPPWLRVRVREATRPGLADEVRELLGPGVVDVVVEHDGPIASPRVRRDGRSPQQLFAEFLSDRAIEDPRLQAGFSQLLEDVSLNDQIGQPERTSGPVAKQ